MILDVLTAPRVADQQAQGFPRVVDVTEHREQAGDRASRLLVCGSIWEATLGFRGKLRKLLGKAGVEVAYRDLVQPAAGMTKKLQAPARGCPMFDKRLTSRGGAIAKSDDI